MIKKIILLSTVLLPMQALAQQSLQDQINAVNQVQENRVFEEQQAMQREKAELDRMRSNAIKSAERKRAAIAAANAAKHAEAMKDKQRNQAYEDELRQLELEDKKLDITGKKAKVARTNEYIDQELKSQAAQTDVVQSAADANRNVSKGTEDLMRSTGRAKEVAAKKTGKISDTTTIERTVVVPTTSAQ
jgi:hypothetical protein